MHIYVVEEPEEQIREMGEDLLDNFLERWDLPLSDKKRKAYPDEVLSILLAAHYMTSLCCDDRARSYDSNTLYERSCLDVYFD